MKYPFRFLDFIHKALSGRSAIMVIFFLLSLMAAGQTKLSPGLSAALIPDSLKLNANAVVRELLVEYTFQSPQSNVEKYRTVITVLNKNGDNSAVFSQSHDKFRRVSSFEGNIYDAAGKLVRKIKNSEVTDVSETVGYPEFGDIKQKYFKPLISIYPFTVEYEWQIDISGSYYFPGWMAFAGYNVSIEKTEFTIRVPAEYHLLYKQYNISGQPVMKQEDKFMAYSWNAVNVKALDYEPYIGNLNQYAKTVYTAPSDFVLDGYPGKFNTWQDYATWIGTLNKGRDILSETTSGIIKELIKDAPDDRSKVKILYSYLQQRTRYFSVQLGIGGHQPMYANRVDEAGYGDCKGLSNYMKAMLKVAGIQSYYTLVNSGSNFPQIEAGFPSDQFNHIILCVPLREDTIWLECTNQTIPFGFLGDFTSDRQVLLIKDDGGELARTPVYSLKDNFQNTSARVTVTQDGNAAAEISRQFGGLQFDDNEGYLNAGIDDQRKWLYDYIDLPNYKISKFDFRQADKDKPQAVLQVSLNIDTYGSSSGKRIFLPVNLINRFAYIPPKLKKRWSKIEKRISYEDRDSVEYLLPDGIEIEFLPGEASINSPFGTYESRITAEKNKIIYVRRLTMFKGIFPSECYDELMKFYHDISIADKGQAVLTKN